MILALWWMGCAGWRADEVVVTGGDADLVAAMLAPWEGVTQRPPRVREVVVADVLPAGCHEACYDPERRTITLDAGLSAGAMNRALSVEMGRALDHGDDGLPLSQTGHWAAYRSVFPGYAADRFARAVGLGPVGSRLFPRPSADCAITDAAQDVGAVQRAVFAWTDLDIAPAAQVDRSIDLTGPWYFLPPERLEGGGLRLHAATGSGYPDYTAAIEIPTLDGEEVWASYPAGPVYSTPSLAVLDLPGETAWAPGVGAELVGNYPAGDTEIAGAWLEAADPFVRRDDVFVVVERDRGSGEIVAVHDLSCPRPEPEWALDDLPYMSQRPVFVPTADGVWVVAFNRTEVRMRRFGYGGEALAPRRLEIDLSLLEGGERYVFPW